jgi:mutator family transposase
MPNADRLSIGNYITQDNETVFASTTVVSMRIRRPVVTPLSRACFVLDGALPQLARDRLFDRPTAGALEGAALESATSCGTRGRRVVGIHDLVGRFACRLAHRPSWYPGAALLGAQDQEYPNAPSVACLRNDLDELLTCFRYKSADRRKAVRTTNAIERRFREIRRRTRPMGTLQDKTSMDRILFAVFTYENKSQGISTLFLLTQNS